MQTEIVSGIGYTEIFRHWFLQSIAMGLTALLIPRLTISSVFGAASMVLGLALVNATLWDTNLFYFLPTNLTYRTGSVLIANGVIFLVLVKVLPGIETRGILPSFVAPIVFTLLSIVISEYGRNVSLTDLASKAATEVMKVKEALMNGAAISVQTESMGELVSEKL